MKHRRTPCPVVILRERSDRGISHQVGFLVPPLCGGTHIGTLRVPGRGAADLSVPRRSVGTRGLTTETLPVIAVCSSLSHFFLHCPDDHNGMRFEE
jgi:hypothetical protein